MRISLLTIALIAVISVTAYTQVQLNNWNAPFYDAIEKRNGTEFVRQLEVFAAIAGALLVLNVLQAWLTQTVTLLLRRGLAVDLLRLWNTCGRKIPHDATYEGAKNPDQRIQEDSLNVADWTVSLSIGLFQSTILLLSFVGILWSVSGTFTLTIGANTLPIPGYMVWIALFYAAAGTLMSAVVGRNLVDQNNRRASFEAEFRKALVDASHVRATETANLHSVYVTSWHLYRILSNVLSSTRMIIVSQVNLTWISAGFGWGGLVVPVLAAAPAYFSGQLTFGGLMVAVGAFNQVNTALRWQINNFSMIAQWRAAMRRIVEFKRQIRATQEKP
jgi:putative ATP-binding cassette transporter